VRNKKAPPPRSKRSRGHPDRNRTARPERSVNPKLYCGGPPYKNEFSIRRCRIVRTFHCRALTRQLVWCSRLGCQLPRRKGPKERLEPLRHPGGLPAPGLSPGQGSMPCLELGYPEIGWLGDAGDHASGRDAASTGSLGGESCGQASCLCGFFSSRGRVRFPTPSSPVRVEQTLGFLVEGLLAARCLLHHLRAQVYDLGLAH
jgi:hypothetical protein